VRRSPGRGVNVLPEGAERKLKYNAENMHSTGFRRRCDKFEMRGTCLETQKSMNVNLVINSLKLYYDTEDTFTTNQRDFPILKRMEKFYRHSAKKCIKYPFDSRAHFKRVRCLWFPTSGCFETWLISFGIILSKQYHESTMVLCTLP